MKLALNGGDKMLDGKSINRKTVMAVSFLFIMTASVAFALTVPTAGLGFAFYTVLNGIYSTGLGYVAAACMFFWGCFHLAKDWKDSLGWMAGGLGAASIPALVSAAGLVL